MVKLLGGLLVLSGGGMAWMLQRRERQRRQNALSELLRSLERMGEEIRMTRIPLPRLLAALAADCGPDTAALFQAAAEAAAQGERLTEIWRAGVASLPLDARDQEVLRTLNFHGDEENLCKAISLVTYCLTKSTEALERRRAEVDKRTAALCFSAAALLVILLI